MKIYYSFELASSHYAPYSRFHIILLLEQILFWFLFPLATCDAHFHKFCQFWFTFAWNNLIWKKGYLLIMRFLRLEIFSLPARNLLKYSYFNNASLNAMLSLSFAFNGFSYHYGY